MKDQEQQPTAVYVGCSSSTERRAAQHRAYSPWWPEVAKTTIVVFDGRLEALVAEATAIRNERPKHNVMLNGWKCDGERAAEILERLTQTSKAVTEAVLARNKVIADAYTEAISYRDIGAVVGLSHSGVRRIINHQSNNETGATP